MTKNNGQLLVLSDEEKDIEHIGELTAFIEATAELKNKAEEIKVVDEGTLTIADQGAVKTKKLLKDIDDKRKEITREWRDKTTAVNNVTKRITAFAEDAKNAYVSKVLAYKAEQEKKRLAELKAAQEKQAKIDRLSGMMEAAMEEFELEINAAKTEDEIKDIGNDFINSQNKDSLFSRMMTLAEEVAPDQVEIIKKIKINMLTIGKARKQEILSPEKAEEIKEQREKLTDHAKENILAETLAADNIEAVETSSKIMELSSKKSSGVRMQKKFRVIDEKKVPKKFLSVDEKKIKDYMKGEENPEIAGIEFYDEAIHVSR